MKLDGIEIIIDNRMPDWGVVLLDAEWRSIGTFTEDEAWPPWAKAAILHPDVLERIMSDAHAETNP